MEISVCVTDDDYEAWRRVRMDVVPGERCDTVAEMRAQDSSDRLLLIARLGGDVVGSGLGDRSDSSGGGFVAPRVRPSYRRRGVGSSLMEPLAAHVAALGLPELRAMVDDPGSLEFAERFGFVEVDRQIEQVRAIGDEPQPSALPAEVEVITLDQRPDLWAACYESFGREVLADFAL
ncbi:MAG TPA: GNAT family N-acetyltransferase, partial [Nocardioides sp.]|nr:GNAT family N-acetyltransferase [Nocardioides sp.]